jgi:hypothetical protein
MMSRPTHSTVRMSESFRHGGENREAERPPQANSTHLERIWSQQAVIAHQRTKIIDPPDR